MRETGIGYSVTPPEGRKAIFVGDLVDRGPDSPGVLRLVMDMVEDGVGICVPGNHETKLQRRLSGRNVKLTIMGWPKRWSNSKASSEAFIAQVKSFIVAADQPLRPGPRTTCRCPCRYEGSLSGAWLGHGSRVCALTEKPPAKPTSTDFPCATTGPRSIAEMPWSSTATPRYRRPSG